MVEIPYTCADTGKPAAAVPACWYAANNNSILLHQLSCGGTGNVLLSMHMFLKVLFQTQCNIESMYHCLGSIDFTSVSTDSLVDEVLDKPV